MNKIIRLILKFLFILLFSLSFSQSENNAPWVKVKDKNGIAVYLRNFPGSPVKEFKTQSIVHAPIKKIVEILLNFKDYPKWVFNNKNTILLENKNNKEYTYYTMITTPKPVSDRDVVIKLIIKELTETKCLIRTKGLPKFVSEKPGIVRVTEFQGMWELTKISDTETQVVSQCHTEPGGAVPAWLINYFIETGPYSTLEKLVKLLK
jgi:hypothetical protein